LLYFYFVFNPNKKITQPSAAPTGDFGGFENCAASEMTKPGRSRAVEELLIFS
jgi:hypothetical protein